jgi:hypothetical protein
VFIKHPHANRRHMSGLGWLKLEACLLRHPYPVRVLTVCSTLATPSGAAMIRRG